MILPPSLQGYDEDARLNGLEATVEPEQVDLHGLVPVPPLLLQQRSRSTLYLCLCCAPLSLVAMAPIFSDILRHFSDNIAASLCTRR